MRFLAGISCALLFAGALFGQYHFGTPVLTGGFGNAVFPAGTHATLPSLQRFTPNAVFPGGGGPHLNVPGQRPARYTGSGAAVVPYAYPIYVGGSGYFDNSYAQGPAPQQQQPNVTVVYPPQPAPVIVNQFGPGAAPQPVAGPPDQDAAQRVSTGVSIIDAVGRSTRRHSLSDRAQRPHNLFRSGVLGGWRHAALLHLGQRAQSSFALACRSRTYQPPE